MRGPGRWWRGKSTPAKVETYTRWSFHSFAVIEVTLFGLPLLEHARMPYAAWLAAVLAGHALLCAVTGSRALDWHRGRREQPLRLMWVLAAVGTALAVGALALADHVPGDKAVGTALTSSFAGVLIFGAGAISLGVRSRRRVLGLVGGCGAGSAGVVLVLNGSVAAALGAGLGVLAGAAFFAFTSVFSVWLLNAVYALDEARETRARLAVAEERLRFGRDLHDVMGRNLAVIALKSELAVQLAQRGRPEAVPQMVEVQRLAREAQREVREVVRGYREADLGSELAGARGVLSAAGIDCTVTGTADGLPAPVQSALGWVVREAATNVLRHGDASRCEVRLEVTEGRVVLSVENDGVPVERKGAVTAGDEVPVRVGGSGGSGLDGLRERLARLDGTLRAGPTGSGSFRLEAEVPVPVPGGSAEDGRAEGETDHAEPAERLGRAQGRHAEGEPDQAEPVAAERLGRAQGRHAEGEPDHAEPAERLGRAQGRHAEGEPDDAEPVAAERLGRAPPGP
ncbi:histidine kinase [Streptomyces sp. DH24]|uniref:histidine kinase n=1 Tax=Streptomyces sp. DH24 TaxID=3040123 RepID=UPI0024423F91|nr:histidine kinase [Streptomyces sp. DH24]MDG9719922.1 histidine kinase [Streptomyces sp. DH24]